ncbi:hypothetical protein BDW42DRAFT_189231 [Aspergillus taichungensis]|uniref:Uncharacterized protein n=1 Tax=Aspergillus taichungensis TaxID=482145 RepID=A0A2J5HEZ4_9EURO|nr:hypothetical protein BDW42DRAFT_189231 [Aspergillus taichungensis]
MEARWSCNVEFSPPQRHEPLKRFLSRAGAQSFPEAAKFGPESKRVLAMVDDRCDPCTQFTNIPENTFLPVRQWESEEYMRRPPEGLHVRIAGGDAEMLFCHLNKDRKGVAERRIIPGGPDPTDGTGFDLEYLQRGFTLEFHLPHYVLRPDQPELRDARGLRKSRSFRLPSPGSHDRIHEVQISLVVIGVDEFFWMAYFSEDSYFRNNHPISEYLQDKTDGPSLGLRLCKFPIWDPRYYFLWILSIRMGQVTMEWRVLVETVEGHLDQHGEIDEDNLDGFLENDPSLQKTKDFTWTLCSLRRLRNSLARLIAAWVAFDRNNSVYFDLNSDGALAAKFRECFSSLRQSMAELGSLQMVLEQRIETMEKMSSVLVNASSLAESITATRQGDNIRLLTYITIVTLSTGDTCDGESTDPSPWRPLQKTNQMETAEEKTRVL